ncbi:hypothetical protein CVU83_00885 [Candidatus Falkowbacteria bacterium HGW-Falkowbacteria-2]|uniref:Uncharacterized protein n=1 Tax=Candidatus Falkowbacteria bacterium HGW-Falkowbacteria-2 TaxID=2013769 RepID=A0A2N2E2N0_9BACT|nr:MAG: hypothetical protein CVU83_00885 [Candidatus Falkowbacteria bacterium HGW-Falkowbacteria-2]
MTKNFVENEIRSTILQYVDKSDALLSIKGEGTEIALSDVRLKEKSFYFSSSLTKIFKSVIWKYGFFINRVQLTATTYERKYSFFPWPRKRYRRSIEFDVEHLWVCDIRVYIKPKNLSDIGEVTKGQKSIHIYHGYLVFDVDEVTGVVLNFKFLNRIITRNQIKSLSLN